MISYYNEIDPYAADWLRTLILVGWIAPGDVDTRSIEDVTPNDLHGYDQCHFFAGIGGWSLALRLAGWSDDRPVWTVSCPCQPFSVAGKRKGTDDERHLWPEFRRLITECNPATVFGEQVASRDGRGWLAAVRADLEGLGYAVGATDLCAAGIGAPHIRQRLYWVADALPAGWAEGRPGAGNRPLAGCGGASGLGNAIVAGLERHAGHGGDGHEPGWLGTDAAGPVATASGNGGLAHRDGYGCDQARGRGPSIGDDGAIGNRAAGRMDDADGEGCGGRGIRGPGESAGARAGAACERPAGLCQDQRPGPLHGLWRDADWLYCRDGKWRPVEASPQPLVDGLPESLGRVCAATIAEVEAEVASYAAYRKTSAAEELRNLCEALDAQAQRGWAPGGLPDLHSAAFLLAFVCQLATQGWQLTQGLPLSGPKAAGAEMRVLWDNEAAARASRQRGLEGQPARERADALHFLSPVLARHAQASWGKAYSAYAEIGFPLGHNAPGRVGRLRAYGNAIVPQVAEAFIRSFCELRGAK